MKCSICKQEKLPYEMFPFIIDDVGKICRGCEAIYWIEDMITLSKGKWSNRKIALMDWEKELIYKIFGQVDENGLRIIRQVYLEIGKKNGKSGLGSTIGLKLLFGDPEPMAEIYGCASDREQGSIIFNEAVNFIEANDRLSGICKIISREKIIRRKNGNIYRVLSSDAPRQHGHNVSGLLFDELHTQPNRELYDTMTIGSSAAREQPLFCFFTTAGYDRESIAFEVHNYAEKVRDGIIKDPSFLPVIYNVDEKADWMDPSLWPEANPSLGIILDLEDMKKECQKAQDVPALENVFRRLRLNQWVKQEARFLPMDRWDLCGGAPKIPDGANVFCGLDVASTTDLAAFVITYIDDEGIYHVDCKFFIPEETIIKRVRTDKVPYDQWVSEGYIDSTPGNQISHDYIRDTIFQCAEKYNIQSIGADRFMASQLLQQITEHEIEVIAIAQTFLGMSPAIKETLKLTLAGRFRHGNNPVLRWCADNAAVQMDVNENYRLDKKKSTERIDGITSLCMAIDRSVRQEPEERSIYEDHELVII